MHRKIKVAACQMQAELGNIPDNLEQARRLIDAAFARGAQWVILPEFFNTAMAFHPVIADAALTDEVPALKLLIEAAKQYQGYVGGSFILLRGEELYNSFVLARPDGTYAVHDKRFPTWWENCYTLAGTTEGVFNTEDARVGAALCWEFARWETAKRLKEKIDLVVGGSCWFAMPKTPIFKKFVASLQGYNFNTIREAPARMARILGVPVVHASHAGMFRGRIPMTPLPYESFYQGETRIIDGTGETLARMKREEGEGVIIAEVTARPIPPSEEMTDDKGWIRLKGTPVPVRAAWNVLNSLFKLHGRLYYKTLKKSQSD